jgi:hypothetical protein
VIGSAGSSKGQSGSDPLGLQRLKCRNGRRVGRKGGGCKVGQEREGREWDRGKVVDDEGDIDVKPEWGRLKGT